MDTDQGERKVGMRPMNAIDVIAERRSIRKFKNTPVPRKMIEQILTAATQAPSGKNRQPWRLVVVQGPKRDELVSIMHDQIAAIKAQGYDVGSSENSTRCMSEAPVTIFIFNPFFTDAESDESWNLVDVQSVGAAIQNMLLAAQDLGLGTLWICDVFYAREELRKWLGATDQMIAAVSIGYPDESPPARPKKSWQEVTTWVGE